MENKLTALVNGVTLFYRISGQGSPVVLLHGFGETGDMWKPLVQALEKTHLVIVPDLRGAGQSEKPAEGYDKKTLAKDIHELVVKLGYDKITIVGHDIGLMVAYAYAAQFTDSVRKIILMDAFLPGIGNWQEMWLLRDLWHFHFYGETPLALVRGRERIYLEHFWNDFAADRTRSLTETDRQKYAAAFAQPGAIEAGFAYFKNFEQDANDFAEFAKKKLPMPMLVLSGEKSGGNFLINQAKLIANQVQGTIVIGSGHWLMEEATEKTVSAIVQFIE